MKSIPRNVILDLLPVYIAGEAFKESRELVEEFAQNDPEIAQLIRAGNIDQDINIAEISIPADLEMKLLKRIRSSIRRQMLIVAIVTASILLIPLIAMLVTNEVNWNWLDFVVMGGLLFGSGASFVLIARNLNHIAYRLAVGIWLLAAFVLIWINLAVGIIGSVDNPANLLYLCVLTIAIVGSVKTRFQPRGMSITMLVTALAQFLVPIIALVVWPPALNEPPGMLGVFLLNGFFAGLFVVAALLMRRAVSKQ